MSRRRSRARPPEARAGGPREAPREVAPRAEGQTGRRRDSLARDIAILLAAFGVGVGVAELAGAANLGVALGVGQIVFAIVLVVLLTRG